MMLTRLALSVILRIVDSKRVLFAGVALAALGATLLLTGANYGTALCAALLIGAGMAAGFPIVLSYVGDAFPNESGAAFSAIFVAALLGNITINKSFGYIAQSRGIQHYATVMLGCLACSCVLLILLVRLLNRDPQIGES
jgi:MFS family permease